jgi:hypothetical protein
LFAIVGDVNPRFYLLGNRGLHRRIDVPIQSRRLDGLTLFALNQ